MSIFAADPEVVAVVALHGAVQQAAVVLVGGFHPAAAFPAGVVVEGLAARTLVIAIDAHVEQRPRLEVLPLQLRNAGRVIVNG
jgi:hypothetical protein